MPRTLLHTHPQVRLSQTQHSSVSRGPLKRFCWPPAWPISTFAAGPYGFLQMTSNLNFHLFIKQLHVPLVFVKLTHRYHTRLFSLPSHQVTSAEPYIASQMWILSYSMLLSWCLTLLCMCLFLTLPSLAVFRYSGIFHLNSVLDLFSILVFILIMTLLELTTPCACGSSLHVCKSTLMTNHNNDCDKNFNVMLQLQNSPKYWIVFIFITCYTQKH